jgi:Calcium-dependent channel, 7TM region, putative phosphate
MFTSVLAATTGFLRVPGAVISWILGKISTSARAKKRTWSQQYNSYGARIPNDSIAMMLLLVFCIAQPLISVVALLYFFISYVYWRYDVLYSYRDAFETGGFFWPVVRCRISRVYCPALFFGLRRCSMACGAVFWAAGYRMV